jgi:hypothetical protein
MNGVTMHKLQLLLAGRGDLGALDRAVRTEVGHWSGARDVPGLRIRRGVRAPEDPFADTAQGSGTGSFHFDAFAEAATTADDVDLLIALATRAASRLGDAVDPVHSAAVVGVEHTIFPGDRRVLLLYALRRLPSLTHEQFCDHWLHKHAEFARATQAERGYRQFHADQHLSAKAAARAGVTIADIDGVAEASYSGIGDFLSVMSNPHVAKDAMEDEKRFIDHSRSAGAVMNAELLPVSEIPPVDPPH